MMTTRELQDEIIRLKKENDICILAHAYQSHEILEVADFTGDSYGLSKQAATAPTEECAHVRVSASWQRPARFYLLTSMYFCQTAQQAVLWRSSSM